MSHTDQRIASTKWPRYISGLDCVNSTSEMQLLFECVPRFRYYIEKNWRTRCLRSCRKAFRSKSSPNSHFEFHLLGGWQPFTAANFLSICQSSQKSPESSCFCALRVSLAHRKHTHDSKQYLQSLYMNSVINDPVNRLQVKGNVIHGRAAHPKTHI